MRSHKRPRGKTIEGGRLRELQKLINNYLITESEIVTGILKLRPCRNTVGRGLRFSRNDRTVKVIKLFIIWLIN